MNAQSLAELLQASQVEPGRWIAHCPGHIDTVPSLTIRGNATGPLILKCDLGCPRADILDPLGLAESDLVDSMPASAEQVAWIREYRRIRASAERYSWRYRRKIWDEVWDRQAEVEVLQKQQARSRKNEAIAKLLHDARCHLHQAELRAKNLENPSGRRLIWM